MSLFEKVDNIEFEVFLNPGNNNITQHFDYLSNETDIKFVYSVILILYTLIGVVSLVVFFCLRNWYIIKQRNFWLTFINGILAFLSTFVTLWVQVVDSPCALSLYTSNVINPLYNSMFLSRSLRIVLLYRFNIYKVTELKKRNRKRLKESYLGEKEPNNYLQKIYKRVNRIIYCVIIVPTVIALIATICLQVILKNIECPFFGTGNATNSLKGNSDLAKLFMVAQVFGYLFATVLLIMLIFLYKIKDNNKYGAKFECISTIFLIISLTIVHTFLNVSINRARGEHFGNMLNRSANNNISVKRDIYPIRLLLIIYNWTKGGKALYCIIACYMIFASIILPCLKCWSSKREKNKYYQKSTNSMQYFYKVLNSPPLVEELKSIAIKEFSVENVLFWENYQVLQKMVYRYQIELKKAERYGDYRLISLYDFEGYYQQQVQSFSVSSMDDYSYDPYHPVPREILPYYIIFYQTFINSLSPSAVNISGATIKRIYNELSTYPTVGIFDNAKNEIVEMMYSSIYPILLRNNRKHLHNNTINF